jgi:hypothetical protein
MTDPDIIEHEIRIRILEETSKDIRGILRWLLSIGVTSIIIPIVLHYYNLTH